MSAPTPGASGRSSRAASDPGRRHGRVPAPEAGTGEIQTIAEATRRRSALDRFLRGRASGSDRTGSSGCPRACRGQGEGSAGRRPPGDVGRRDGAGAEAADPDVLAGATPAAIRCAGRRDRTTRSGADTSAASRSGLDCRRASGAGAGGCVRHRLRDRSPSSAPGARTGIAAGAQDTAGAPAPPAAASSAVPSGATAPWQENPPRSGGVQTARARRAAARSRARRGCGRR